MRRGELLLTVSVLGTPRPKARPRFAKGRVVTTTSKHEKLWRTQLVKHVRELRWTEPLCVPVIVDAAFYFEAKTADRLGRPHTHRPDKDNLEKLVLDCLTKERVIKDDALVVGGETTKEWMMAGGATISVYAVAD